MTNDLKVSASPTFSSMANPQYAEMSKAWAKMLDCIEGESAIKEKDQGLRVGESAYLRRAQTQDDDSDWKDYVHRAAFTPYLKRCIQGYYGLITSGDPIKSEILTDGRMSDWAKDVDGCGTPLDLWVKNTLLMGVLSRSRVGVMVDVGEAGLPVLVAYDAASIVDWQQGGANQFVIVKEIDANTLLEKDHLRVVRDPAVEYRLICYEEGRPVSRLYDQSGSPISGPDYYMISGEALTEWPLTIINDHGVTFSAERPMLEPIADLNIKHYEWDAVKARMIILGMYPIVWSRGFGTFGETRQVELPDGAFKTITDDFSFANFRGWHGMEDYAEAGLTEYQAFCFPHAESQQQKTLDSIVAMGLRMLDPKDPSSVRLETTQLNKKGENSAVGALADNVSDGLESSLRTVAKWLGAESGDIKYRLETDYLDLLTEVSFKDILLGKGPGPLLTEREAFEVAVKKGVISKGTSFEEHQAQMEKENAAAQYADPGFGDMEEGDDDNDHE